MFIMKIVTYYIPIFVLTAFALLTLFLSSSVIFDMFGIREKEGNYVLFIVWANFISSILYLLAAFKWYKLKQCAFKILSLSGVILILAQVSLFVYINDGGIYEEKTIKAMFFRIGLTIVFAVISYFSIPKLMKSDH